ncbi:hypothetical protein [Ferrimonas marina]|uniref:Universal stress protein B n=1 Tax=Ferrimonas marina TaxID=299255 RepID=A0A1M5Z489_9GAMM|nr:hypothetical protein [Ferrimonas marina]SHI19096.1 hypothetical protein SAMN02745129_4626 [Ferrimonas marina]
MVIFIFALYCALAITIVYVSDALLKIQYTEFSLVWKRDKRPRGYFFVPKGSSVASFWERAHKDVDSQYDWVKGHQRAARLFRIYKALKRVFIGFTIVLIPLMLVLKVFGY